jgi:O-antigen/teichoic acid export membrane protein
MTTDVFDLCAGRSDEYAGTHRADRFNNLNRSTVALLVNTAVTGFVGFGYWILAAHLFSKSAVGTAAALISASTLLSGLGQLNLSSTLMRFLPSARDHSARLILSAYGVAAGLSLALATAVMVTTIVFGDSGSPLHLPVWEAVLFCICVAVNSVFVLEDAALLGLRRSMWVPIENIGFGVAKLGTLVAASVIGSSYSVFASWFLPLVLTVPIVNGLMFRRALGWPAQPIRTSNLITNDTRESVRRFIIGDAGNGIFQQTLTYALPWLVTSRLGSKTDALFYAALLFTTSIDLVASNLTSALTVEGSHHPASLPALIRRTLLRSGVLTTFCVLGLVVGAPFILDAYGSGYADAANTLRVLALACVPRAACLVFFGVCRVQQRTHISAKFQALTCIVTLLGAFTLTPSHGIGAVAASVLLGQLVCVGMALPTLIKLARQ